jgi:dGTP triphosphohydrolase
MIAMARGNYSRYSRLKRLYWAWGHSLLYADHLREIEGGVGEFGFRSERGHVLDGTPSIEYYSKLWESSSENEAKLTGRSPSHLDRDRVLYSDSFRGLDDKFHTLYYGSHRRTRNYTTHSLRAAHVARVAAQRLRLNVELAEAIALAAKVGSTPFIHRGRVQVDKWVRDQIVEMDKHRKDTQETETGNELFKLDPITQDMVVPSWLGGITSPGLRAEVQAIIPWAEGDAEARAYHSGVESYWTLTTNPFLRETTNDGFLAETMYGAWRHSLTDGVALSNKFTHTMSLDRGRTRRIVTHENASHEAMVVRYCDDITWVLENLNEAARVEALDGTRSVYTRLAGRYNEDFAPISEAILSGDSGKIYTYFIDDLVKTSEELMRQHTPRQQPSEVEPVVSLSARATRILKNMKVFLGTDVFTHPKLVFRNETLDVILMNVLNLLYRSIDKDEEIVRLVEKRARVSSWDDTEKMRTATDALRNPLHRVQATVDVVSSMSDADVFDLIGLD